MINITCLFYAAFGGLKAMDEGRVDDLPKREWLLLHADNDILTDGDPTYILRTPT